MALSPESLPKLPPLPTSPESATSTSSTSTTLTTTPSNSTVTSPKTPKQDSNSLQLVHVAQPSSADSPSRYKSRLVKTITSFYRSKSTSSPPNLTSAALFLRNLHTADPTLNIAPTAAATAAHISHRQSLALLYEPRKAIMDAQPAPQTPSTSTPPHKQATTTPSSIPRPTPTKRKRKVSNLLSRLSSSTASSRAKADLKKTAPQPHFDSQIPKPRALLRKQSDPVLSTSSPNSRTYSPHNEQTQGANAHIKQQNTTQTTPNLKQQSLAPPVTLSTAASSTPTTPALRATRASSLPNSLPLRSAAPRAGTPSPSAPTSPMHLRRQSEGFNATSVVSMRATSRMKTHRRSVGSRSLSSYSPRSQSTLINPVKVEELKSKINELEEVLMQEKAERDSVYTRMSRISSLEAELDREKIEKARLLTRLKIYEGGYTSNRSSLLSSNPRYSTHSAQSDGASSFTSVAPSLEDRGTMVGSPFVDDWRRLTNRDSGYSIDALEVKVRTLEQEVEKRDLQLAAAAAASPNDDKYDQTLEFQNNLTELKLKKEALRNENETLRTELQFLRDNVKTLSARTQLLDRKLCGKNTQLDQNEVKLKAMQDQVDTITQELEEERTRLSVAKRSTEEVASKLRQTESDLSDSELQTARATKQMQALRNELERVRLEAEQEATKALHNRRQLEKQVAGLQRDNRRSARVVTALETSVQDLKISLEEKAMENDELNRSIQKVMEQANDTIEGAKRHSTVSSAGILLSPNVSGSSPTTAPFMYIASPSLRSAVSSCTSISEHDYEPKHYSYSSYQQQPQRNSLNSLAE